MLKHVLDQERAAADAALEQLLPPATQYPTSIHQAMRHSVFAGGKRLRPILCMEAGRMICRSGPSLPAGIDELGAAIEMLHTYSLIHDDLPALDNDDLRRGRPPATRSLAKPPPFWQETLCKLRPTKCWRNSTARLRRGWRSSTRSPTPPAPLTA